MLRTLSLLLLIVTVGYSQWRDSSRVLVPAPSGKAVKVTQFAIGDTNTWKVSGAIAYMGGNFYIANGTYYVLMAGSGSSSADTATFVTKNTTQVVSAPKYFTARQHTKSISVDSVLDNDNNLIIYANDDDTLKIGAVNNNSYGKIVSIYGFEETSQIHLYDTDIQVVGGLIVTDEVTASSNFHIGGINPVDSTFHGYGAHFRGLLVDSGIVVATRNITATAGYLDSDSIRDDGTTRATSGTWHSGIGAWSLGAITSASLTSQGAITSTSYMRGTDSIYTTSATSFIHPDGSGTSPRLGMVKASGFGPEMRFLSSSPSTFTIRRVTAGTILAPTASTADMVIGATGNVTWSGGNHSGMGTVVAGSRVVSKGSTTGEIGIVGDSTNAAKDVIWYTVNRGGDSSRWVARVNGAETEASAGAGSNWSLHARTDAGAYAGDVLSFTRSTGAAILGSFGSGTLSLKTNNTVRWYIGATAGAFTPNADSTYDIGGTSNYVKNLYVKGGYINGYLAASSPTLSEVTRVNSATNSTVTGFRLRAHTSSTSASGYGGFISMFNKDADGVDREMADIYWTALGGAKNTGRLGFYTSTGGVSGLRMNIDSAGINIQSLPLKMNGTAVISSAGQFFPAGLATVGPYGVSGQVDTITYAGIASGISKNLTSTAGMYRLVYTMFCTTADAAAGSVQLTLSFNNGAAQTMTSAAVNLTSTANKDDDVFVFYVASGTPTVTTAITGSAGTSKYSLHATVERLK